MKVGFESRTRTAAACTLMSLAFLLLGRLLPILQAPSFMAQSAGMNGSPLNGVSKDRVPNDSRSLDPTLNGARLEFAESKRYEGSGRNIFRADPEPLPNKIAPAPLPNSPSPVVAATRQIPLRFFGFVSMLGTPRKGFFGDADAVFVASEGKVIDRRYRIVRIEVNRVEVEDLIEHSTHTLSLPGQA